MDGRRFFTGFIRDLTERQQTEARLQELQNELVHVSRLTALGEMASALAHAINQPLSAITNYLKGSRLLLERDEVPLARIGEVVERAAHEALRAGEIIRRLRDFVAWGGVARPSRADDRHRPGAIDHADAKLARVTVADTGAGVDPEVADRLFQPFITTKRAGMGVGLSISTIVEAHGGRIWAANEGGGAVFGFTVQRAHTEELFNGE